LLVLPLVACWMIPLLLGVRDALLRFRWNEVGGCSDK
jgi:hypothetical protein